MNERYMELDKQASDYYWSLDDGVRNAEAYTKKFAELIVRECMSNLYLHGYDDARTQIQEHFGVEE